MLRSKLKITNIPQQLTLHTFLGVTIDRNLNWKLCVKNIKTTIAKVVRSMFIVKFLYQNVFSYRYMRLSSFHTFMIVLWNVLFTGK